ncbi:NitT/TauT family transport system ATP-binding protein [Paucimonas lemoignei]|uniref:NitT/TauT family transport system ATP-binding protein n=1 Tax=Paucimonas lemoignei TaxID=29443 RepID=A0A4R3I2A0_PAULE|nr:ABC transporter ATP-binding protein [Paucimonas lemoignei]TCS38009.1 NitT/TauT family transport system ATP-binding protein [Paucimonas lemoignei]
MTYHEHSGTSGLHAGRIVFEGVSKRYDGKAGSPGTLALDNLNLSIAPSEIVAVLGPTGCGKSSALNLIAGFEEPTQGRILVDGKAVHDTHPDRAIVFQHGALFPWLTVFDNTVLGLKSRGIDKQTYTRQARELLAEVGLSGFENHYPYQLSGGMQQRVQIARALVSAPRILLMDEPFGALDYQTRIQMQELLLQLWQDHRPTVFFITHDVTEAIFVADRVLVMSSRPGRVSLEVPVRTPKPRAQDFLSSPEFIALQGRLLQAVQNEVRSARAASPISS